MTLQEALEDLMDDAELSDAELEALALLDIDELSRLADGIGETADYAAEALLEAAAEREALSERLEERVRSYWLELRTVPGGTAMEIVVRAAELLAALAQRRGLSRAELTELSGSEDWRQRLVAAWSLRGGSEPWCAELLQLLRDDPFRDEEGNYLVREGAGAELD